MDTNQIVQLLIAERDRLNGAIAALTGNGTGNRRGRPPASEPKESGPSLEPKTAGRKWTAAQRKAAAERMKLRWKAKKKAPVKKAAKKTA